MTINKALEAHKVKGRPAKLVQNPQNTPVNSSAVQTTGNAIRAIRDAWLLTQEEFAKVLRVSRGWVNRTEAAEYVLLRRDTLQKLAEAMGQTPDQTFSLMLKIVYQHMNPDLKLPPVEIPPPKSAEMDGNADKIMREGICEIPMYDLSLAAGPWSDVLDVQEIADANSVMQGLFRVRLSGDSMTPTYRDGMIVEFECLRDGVHPIEAGRDYYVQRDDGTATFKRVEAVSEESITLRALNQKKYPKPMHVDRVNITRMAIARGEFRPF